MQGTVKMYDPATREGIVVLDTDRSELVLASDALASVPCIRQRQAPASGFCSR